MAYSSSLLACEDEKMSFIGKSVVFDMDGVITNTMPDHYLSWRSVLKKEGINVTRDDIYSREGQRGINSVKELFEKYNKRFIAKTAQRILNEKEEYFKEIAKIRFVKGARPFIRKLFKQGFLLGLVTGTSRHELERILPEPLLNLFHVIVTANDVRNGKPHPEPYLKAIRKLSIKTSDAIVIENAPFGIRSAKCAGLKCLALTTSLPASFLTGADAVFPSLKMLEENVTFSCHSGKKR